MGRRFSIAYLADLFARILRLGRTEVGALVALTVIAGGVATFLEVADDMTEADGQALDLAVLRALRPNPANLHDALGPPWLEHAMAELTSLGGLSVLLAFATAAVGFLVMQKRRGSAMFLGFTLAGGLGLSEFFKGMFERGRPDAVYRTFETINASFPSGHALMATVFYLTIGVMVARTQTRKRVKAYMVGVAVALALIVGVTRVWLGAHWLSDVLAGWSLGAAWAMFVWLSAYLIARWRARHDVASLDHRR
ncbi:MAG TPA: phosphatase PAP2 family protein [Caulobacteraceae bacterium]